MSVHGAFSPSVHVPHSMPVPWPRMWCSAASKETPLPCSAPRTHGAMGSRDGSLQREATVDGDDLAGHE